MSSIDPYTSMVTVSLPLSDVLAVHPNQTVQRVLDFAAREYLKKERVALRPNLFAVPTAVGRTTVHVGLPAVSSVFFVEDCLGDPP